MSSSDRFDLTGKTALVTGGAQGIGQAVAVALAQQGADVAVVDRSPAGQTAARIIALGRRSWRFQQDLGQLEALHPLADRAWAQMGRIDILVNNAGTGFLERFNQVTPESWNRTLSVNLHAVFFLTQRVAEHMIANGVRGRVISVSSTNGLVAEPGMAPYNASKGGLEVLTKSLAIELGEHGITVNTVCPGMVENVLGMTVPMDFANFLGYFRQHVPLEHRLATLEECAGAVVFLASSAASYITGQHVVVDGGLLAEQLPRMQFMAPYRNTLTRAKPGLPRPPR